jgi:hypothetical protein
MSSGGRVVDTVRGMDDVVRAALFGAHDRYNRSPRWTALAGAAALVAAVYGLLYLHEPSLQQTGYLLLYIGVAFWILAVVMAIGFVIVDRRIEARAAALFLTVIGDGVLYSTFGISILTTEPNPDYAIDFARACFIVGSTIGIIGNVFWIVSLAVTGARLMIERRDEREGVERNGSIGVIERTADSGRHDAR